MSFQTFVKHLFAAMPSDYNGKWDWSDLLSMGGTINGIFGKDRTENVSNGKFDLSDLGSGAGALNAIKGNIQKQVENTTGILDNILPDDTSDKIQEMIPEGLKPDSMKPENVKPEIPDNTEENIEIGINGNNTADIMQFMKDQQAAQWEREDQIRKETQEREDDAWQRSIEDMRKAGINPNLVNAQPAASGGGITQATGLNYSMYQEEIKTQLTLLEQMIDNDFNASEEEKNRFTDILQSLIMLMTFKK